MDSTLNLLSTWLSSIKVFKDNRSLNFKDVLPNELLKDISAKDPFGINFCREPTVANKSIELSNVSGS